MAIRSCTCVQVAGDFGAALLSLLCPSLVSDRVKHLHFERALNHGPVTTRTEPEMVGMPQAWPAGPALVAGLLMLQLSLFIMPVECLDPSKCVKGCVKGCLKVRLQNAQN